MAFTYGWLCHHELRNQCATGRAPWSKILETPVQKMQCTAKLNIAKLTLQGWVNTDTLLDHYKRINFPADKDIFLEFSIWSDPPKFTKVSTRSDPTRLDPWVDQTRGHLCVINASIVNSKLLENVFCSDLDLWTRDLQTKRKGKYSCKDWLKSLHGSWTTAFKDLFSHRCTADLQLRTNCLLNVISFICTCWRLIVTSFIKVSPAHKAERSVGWTHVSSYSTARTDGETLWNIIPACTRPIHTMAEAHRVAQNKIPHRRICNISAISALILTILDAA